MNFTHPCPLLTIFNLHILYFQLLLLFKGDLLSTIRVLDAEKKDRTGELHEKATVMDEVIEKLNSTYKMRHIWRIQEPFTLTLPDKSKVVNL